jgi:hypothetical protein
MQAFMAKSSETHDKCPLAAAVKSGVSAKQLTPPTLALAATRTAATRKLL